MDESLVSCPFQQQVSGKTYFAFLILRAQRLFYYGLYNTQSNVTIHLLQVQVTCPV